MVIFTLLHREDVEKEEAGAEGAETPSNAGDKTDEGKEDSRHEGEENFVPQADDLD